MEAFEKNQRRFAISIGGLEMLHRLAILAEPDGGQGEVDAYDMFGRTHLEKLCVHLSRAIGIAVLGGRAAQQRDVGTVRVGFPREMLEVANRLFWISAQQIRLGSEASSDMAVRLEFDEVAKKGTTRS